MTKHCGMAKWLLASAAAALMAMSATSTAAAQVQFVSKAGTYCMDIEGGRPYQGAPIIAWPCHSQANQKFSYDPSTKRIHSAQDRNLCVDIAGGRADGQLLLWGCHGGANQKWRRG